MALRLQSRQQGAGLHADVSPTNSLKSSTFLDKSGGNANGRPASRRRNGRLSSGRPSRRDGEEERDGSGRRDRRTPPGRRGDAARRPRDRPREREPDGGGLEYRVRAPPSPRGDATASVGATTTARTTAGGWGGRSCPSPTGAGGGTATGMGGCRPGTPPPPAGASLSHRSGAGGRKRP